MCTIENALEKKLNGLYYGNRAILPFNCHFLKVIFEDEIITDFSSHSEGIILKEEKDFTDLYFPGLKSLNDSVSKFEAIKMVVVEKGENIFDLKNHKKIAVYLEDKHNLKIEKTDDDILFIE